MIPEDRCARALAYLGMTDEESAQLKGQVSRKEYLAKMVRAKVFLVSEGCVEARKALAESSEEVMKAEDELTDAIIEHEKCKAKRTTEALVIDVWRSVEASRRHGNI